MTTRSTTLPASVSPREAQRLIQEQNAFLLDVRGFEEFANHRAPEAVCVPLPDLERRAAAIPTNRPVLVCCQSGGRSAMAVERLRALGFDTVINIEGGMSAWTAAGLLTTKQRGVIPLERQVRGIAGTLIFGLTLAGLFVHPAFLYGTLFIGFMLFQSGVTGLCPMLSLLKVMPWNRVTVSTAAALR
jgi:rhodanese-related sulfurtransferase